MFVKSLVFFGVLASLRAQETGTDNASPGANATIAPEPSSSAVDKRVFGVLPNYRTANLGDDFHPLSAKRKFYIGYKDSTDYPIFLLGGGLAALGQLTNQHPEFHQGMVGYAKRYGASTSDQIIGNFLTESIMPALLHQDPRYFRMGQGSTKARLGYAATRIFVAKNDSGRWNFNYSEVVGNAMVAGIGNAYYPGERHLSDNVQRLYTQLATDALSQVLKEFWPDVKRKFFTRKLDTQSSATDKRR